MPPKSDDVCDDTSTAAGSRFGKEMDGFFCLRVVNKVAYHHHIVFGGYANRMCIQPKPSSSSSSSSSREKRDAVRRVLRDAVLLFVFSVAKAAAVF